MLAANFTTIEEYCDNYIQYYLSVSSAVESLTGDSTQSNCCNPYQILPGLASSLFVLGTENVDWLDTWRQNKILDSKNRYMPLEYLMSTIRQVEISKSKILRQNMVAMTTRNGNEGKSRKMAPRGPDNRCWLCRHRHIKKKCFRQQPALKSPIKKSNIKDKEKTKASTKVALEEQDKSESERDFDIYDNCKNAPVSKLARAASANLMKNPLLYDIGLSHHFIRHESDFVTFKKLKGPFWLEQADGSSELTHGGTSRFAILSY